jgi:fructosamine-3-kinase
LWGGNWGVVSGAREPAIFDPAVYYGDRETDLAMPRIFGGGNGRQAEGLIGKLLAEPGA